MLGVGVAFSPLRICYVGNYWCESDANFYIHFLISGSGVVNSCCEIIVYVVYVVSCVGIGLLGRVISPTKEHYLQKTTKTQNKRIQTSMP
jgi:hypothetical protein